MKTPSQPVFDADNSSARFVLADGAMPQDREMQTLVEENKALQGKLQTQERLIEELEGFTYSVAHDLRAPLRFIDKFAYLLMEKHGRELSSEALQYAEQIREASRQTTCLVEDLLTLAQLTGQDLDRKAIDMTEMAHKIVALSQIELDGRTVCFQVDDLGHAYGDPVLMQQVFANLIGNAVKFTRPREEAQIKITCDTTVEPVIYTVSDNGVGFDTSESDRIFAIFQRYHQPDEFEGTGVGLAVVKRIVTRHGGKCWAESQAGHGARFHFSLAGENPPCEGAPSHGR